ncbi:DUF1853 family protein [Psychrobacter sp. 1U2]|uniref:DUF1853 family protein n=1 Tax=Psychrobacter sp. 1U2 TaxID=3453577 RepID=UPI003F466D5C
MFEPTAQLLSNATLDSDNTPWEAYRHPYVRDLAFVLACPNVLTHWIDFSPDQITHQIAVHSSEFWLAQYRAYQQRLEELDNTTAYQQLTRYLLSRPSPNRLGFHFEGLLSFWLEDGYKRGLHPYETLASNIQLYNDKQTVGELDLILYNHYEQQTEHWELAIKFFMGSYPFAPENWVGINSNDNLERKMTYMQNKQFRSIWVDTESHGRVKIDKRYGVIKGRFFLPINYTNFTYADWLEPTFPMHKWCDINDETNLSKLDKSALRQAQYIEWFTKRGFYDDRQSLSSMPLWSAEQPPKAGLYFIEDRPLVIYPYVSTSS